MHFVVCRSQSMPCSVAVAISSKWMLTHAATSSSVSITAIQPPYHFVDYKIQNTTSTPCMYVVSNVDSWRTTLLQLTINCIYFLMWDVATNEARIRYSNCLPSGRPAARAVVFVLFIHESQQELHTF